MTVAIEFISAENELRRIRGEFLEMPGMRVTPDQAGRLLGLTPEACEMLLAALMESGFLCRTHDGAYVRCDVSSCCE